MPPQLSSSHLSLSCPDIDPKKLSSKITSVRGIASDSASATDIYQLQLDDGREVYMKVFSIGSNMSHYQLVYEFYVYLIKIKFLNTVCPNFVTPIAGKLGCTSSEIVDYLDGRVKDIDSGNILSTYDLVYRLHRNLTIANLALSTVKKRPTIDSKSAVDENLYGYIVSGPSYQDIPRSIRSLHAFLVNTSQTLYQANILDIVAQLAVACYCMSTSQLVHNDLHTGNVLLYTYDQPKNIQYNFGSVQINISTKYVVKIYDFDRSNMNCFRTQDNCQNKFNINMVATGQDSLINDMKDFLKVICYLFETPLFKRSTLVLKDQISEPTYKLLMDSTCFYDRNPFLDTDPIWSKKFDIFVPMATVLRRLSSVLVKNPTLTYDEYDLQPSTIINGLKTYEDSLQKCEQSQILSGFMTL